MAKNNRTKSESMSNLEGIETETSELFKNYIRLKPIFTSNQEAATAVCRQLDQLAYEHGMTTDALIEQAHTTQDSQSFHIEALSLVRQLNFLLR